MTKNKYLKGLLFASGILSTLLGGIGAVLPLIPATPFFLLAAFCFAKSNKKMYTLLMNNKLFGKQLQNYRDKKGISILSKIITVLFIWPSVLFTVYFVSSAFVRIPLLTIALFATTHVLSIKTLQKKE